MRIILYLLLFLNIICENEKKPSKYIKKCFKKRIGKGGYDILYYKFEDYLKLNKEASFSDLIKVKVPELNQLLNKCKEKERKSIERLAKERLNDFIKKKAKKIIKYDDDDD